MKWCTTRHALILLLTAGSMVTAPAAAQEDRSVFSLLETRERSLEVGRSVEGVLAATDPLSAGGRRVQVWRLAVPAGEPVQVDLVSGAFDAFLYVVGPGLGEGLRDDDGGSGLDSRICFVPREEGEYRVVASSLGGETGDFLLRANLDPEGRCGGAEEVETLDLDALPAEGRVLEAGANVEGALSADDLRFYGSPVQAWEVPGRAGESFSVDLRSTDFDAFLTLTGPGLEGELSDDDGAGRCDSRITLSFPEDGSYHLVVSSLSGAQGRFTLTAASEPGPELEGSCVPPSSGGTEEVEDEVTLEEVGAQGPLPLPGSVEGAFTGSETVVGGRPLQGWQMEATAGERIAVTNLSPELDTYLLLSGPGFPRAISDDDGAGDLDARLCVEVPETGIYTVFAGPFSSAPRGSEYRLETVVGPEAERLCGDAGFTLSPARLVAELSAMDTGGRVISQGEEIPGTLTGAVLHPTSGEPVEAWRLEGQPGSILHVDAVSDDFDTTLRAVWSGATEELFNDDFGEGCNSRLEIPLPESGSAIVLVGSFSDVGRGAYRIRVSTDPGPLEAGGCGGSGGGSMSTSDVDVHLLEGLEVLEGRTLPLGAEVAGRLVEGVEEMLDGTPVQAWELVFDGDGDLVVEVLSDDFDTVLHLMGPGIAEPLFDDDSAGSLDSRIVVEGADPGRYTVVVGALSGGSGGFGLRALRRIPR